MNKVVNAFLSKVNFPINNDVNSIVDNVLYDMNEGLCRRKAGQDMILTYSCPPENHPVNKTVIVIDAGGTNFRSCLVNFDSEGNPSISEMQKTKMPGIEKELSKKEFFDQFAENLEHLKDKATDIGFCFSYPMTITEDKDGILIGFAKEIKAPEVNGCKIGYELKNALKEHGWKNELNVTLLNDTVAALLAGASSVEAGVKYSSYVGFILGTGINGAYIQEAGKYDNVKEQIIVCESGKVPYIKQADFDRIFDEKSSKKGTSLLEKQSSGAYLGQICTLAFNLAAEENIFSEKLNSAFAKAEFFSLIVLNDFIHHPYSQENELTKFLLENNANQLDFEITLEIIDAIFDRSARNTAGIIAACVIQSNKGKSITEPVCVLCNGTTFYKTYKLRQRVEAYLDEVLTKQRNLYYRIATVEDDITFGTALAGLM